MSSGATTDDHGLAGLDQALATFTAVRPRLFGVAYRMLGSVSEAEDILQDVWLRWQSCDRGVVRDATAFLMTTTTRVCVNELQSARVRRETYIGPWLPEPVDTSADPALGAERAEALELATLMLLERLPPAERAAYVLREAFDYPYQRIAQTIEVSEANARQLVSRARKHLAVERRAPVDPAVQRRLLAMFLKAAADGDMAELERLLATDVVSYTDGNGARNAARIPVVGRVAVARFVCAFRDRAFGDAVLSWVVANGQPAVHISHVDGAFEAFLALSASEDGIDQLLWFRREEKVSQFTAGRH
jgi:RNA polymerase sigma-70 factor (ECF subfamily)